MVSSRLLAVRYPGNGKVTTMRPLLVLMPVLALSISGTVLLSSKVPSDHGSPPPLRKWEQDFADALFEEFGHIYRLLEAMIGEAHDSQDKLAEAVGSEAIRRYEDVACIPEYLMLSVRMPELHDFDGNRLDKRLEKWSDADFSQLIITLGEQWPSRCADEELAEDVPFVVLEVNTDEGEGDAMTAYVHLGFSVYGADGDSPCQVIGTASLTVYCVRENDRWRPLGTTVLSSDIDKSEDWEGLQ